ncbi:MAG: trimethylamine methyltransferase family protein [Sedimentisphaerales bacterium]|nr:trimethylamine methyltransferase family protein [Sedimentisphaerales bacterium]
MFLNKLSMLSHSELKQIDAASLSILSNVGVQINSDSVLEILAEAGAKVDKGEKTVRFTEDMTRSALSTVPPEIKLYSRDLQSFIVLGKGRMAAASGHNATFVVDSNNGQRRNVTKDDIADFAKIADGLEDIDLVGIQAMPQDVKEEATLLHAYQASVLNSSKHIFFSPESVDVVKAILQMARLACGKTDLYEASPVTCQLSPTSPLMWEPGAVDGVIECARAGVPLCILPQPFSGVTAPVTIAGLLAQHNAELLSGIIIAQLVRPGTPVIWGSAWTTFDMKKANVLICSPEAAALRVAGAQLAAFYKIPSHTIGPDADTHAYDQQLGWEKMLSTISALGAGIDLLVNAGMFGTGMTVSLEQLVIDAEIISICRRFIEGITVNDNTLAVDVVQEIGPRGNFMENPHTLNQLRAGALWEENISNRFGFDAWQAHGSSDIMAKAADRVKAILASHKPKSLPQDVQQAIGKIIEEFEAKYEVVLSEY